MNIRSLSLFRVVACCLALLLTCLTLVGCSAPSSGTGSAEGAAVGGGLSEADLDRQRQARFGMGTIPTAEGEGIFRDVFFNYDQSLLDDRARQDVEFNVEILRNNPDVKIQLEGHCDERGTAEYNLALGEARALTVRKVLESYGVDPSRLATISYGEEVPMDSAQNETAWAKNRRVHFSAFRDLP